MSAARRNPVVFVIGCQRSGTTLLQRMLDHHPDLAVGYDSHFIPRPLRRLDKSLGVDPPLTPAIVDQVSTFHRFARLGIPAPAIDIAACGARTYGAFVSRLYDAFATMHGKPFAGEKSPGYCRHVAQLHGLFPESRFVHLVRDGRDVTLSILDWRKGPAKLDLFDTEPVATCALWWERDLRCGRGEGKALGAALYREIRYEALVAEPAETMRDLAAFLGLADAPEMARYHEGKTRSESGRSAKASWLPPTPGLRDWRTQMSRRDLEVFEAVAGATLEAFGYERAVPDVPPGARAVAERCRAWWNANVRRRLEGEDDDASDRDDERRARRAARAAAKAEAGGRGPAAPSAGANPYVFIVGCPRSGTTLLKRIVDAHERIAITPETHWIPRFWRKRVGVKRDGTVTPEILAALFAYRKFGNLKIDPADVGALLAGDRPVGYAGFVSGVFDLYARRRRKPLAGDKTPGYVQHLPLLSELWPSARFVHIVRDGRDVALSVLDWDRAPRTAGRFATWEDDRLTTAALWWERFVRLGREAGRILGPERYHELRYEDLVADQAGVCRAICRFLDVPYDDAMERFSEGRTKNAPDLSAKRAWRPVTAGLRDWRRQMSAADLERFEAAAGALLEEIGYERGAPAPGREAQRHAATMRDRFTKDPHFKERALPAVWSG
jgi:hypothetical protein